jgi:hypothetical protein
VRVFSGRTSVVVATAVAAAGLLDRCGYSCRRAFANPQKSRDDLESLHVPPVLRALRPAHIVIGEREGR